MFLASFLQPPQCYPSLPPTVHLVGALYSDMIYRLGLLLVRVGALQASGRFEQRHSEVNPLVKSVHDAEAVE